MDNEEVLASGAIDRIGQDMGEFKFSSIVQDKTTRSLKIENHEHGVELILQCLIDPKYGVVKDKNEIKAVGHRIVHGAEEFTGTVVITPRVIKKVEECASLAPLHNTVNLKGIYACQKFLPNVIQCGTFDTAFHQTMPQHAFMYPIPYEYYDTYKIRKYGFHGSSHNYISKVAASTLGFDYNNCKIITCHLGNGASIAAIENGKSIDTSMGLTPLEGLMMGTRSGDFDPGALLYLMQKETKKNETVTEAIKRIDDLLNKKSGMIGISGFSDMRDALNSSLTGNEKSTLALTMYSYRVKKYIGSYAAAMNGVDILVFSGGIGENAINIREAVCSGLTFLGLDFDLETNNASRGELKVISKPNSKLKVIVVPTNEELVIARETKELI